MKIRFTGIVLLVLVTLVTSQEDIIRDVKFSINEELEKGTFIGNIAAETKLGMENDYRFKIIVRTVGIDVNTIVALNQTTGELTTANVIDREYVCSYEKACVIDFEVTAFKDSFLETIQIELVIVDINDNTPTFPKKNISFELSELKPEKSEILLQAATDLDTGINNSVSEYEFSPFSTPNDNFGLKIDKSHESNLAVSLQLLKELDREIVQDYTLYILAKDAGVPVRTGTLTVSITVLDENDNIPVFDDPVLNVTVTEDILVGKVIVALKARDIDANQNGEVFYRLTEQQSADIKDNFAIDSITGELSVAQKLNYEAGNSEKIIYIQASDKGSSPRSSQATVYLTILDAGNNPPQITLTFLKTEISASNILVSENAALNEAVVHVNVEDSDSGNNGNVTCSTYNTYFGLQEVLNSNSASTPGRKGYKVFVQHLLNRESKDTHNVTVTCIDGGYFESSVSFTVTVKDENDNAPKFSHYVYKDIEIKENNTYGDKILTVNATDADIGENGRISFDIHPDNAKEFEVEESSGTIRAKAILDREKYGLKIIQVLAIDHGTPEKKTSTATVMLTILDINDNKPVFTKSPFQFEVQENMLSGTTVDQVTATDDDQGDNRKLEYYLLPDYVKGAAFEVPFSVIENGEIITNTELDREEISVYNFKVGVRDFGVPSLNNSVDIQVKVGDVNDQVPSFMFPAGANKSVVAFNEVSKTEITQVHGVDNDTGINQELIYFIVSGNDDEIFRMDSDSGKLYIEKYVHLTADKTFSLYLSVFDKGQPPLSSKEYLYVRLQFSNATTILNTGDEANNSYIIIVITVVCITCLLSVTIITVICLIRRKDIHKCGKSDQTKLSFTQTKKVESTTQLGNDRIYPKIIQPKKPKEVSFSDEGDSFSSNDFKGLPIKDKNHSILPSRQTTLKDMPEETEDQSGNQPISILRPSQQPFSHSDVQLNVSHQREDSHSETSAETVTSHDSGKGGSVEGDMNHDLKFDLNPLNTESYIIKEGHHQPASLYRNYTASPMKNFPPKIPPLPKKAAEIQRPTSLQYSDTLNSLSLNLNPDGTTSHRTRNWCQNQNLDSTSSYPDSDYLSLGSTNHNHSYSRKISYTDPSLTWGSRSSNPSKLSQIGYINQGYGNTLPSYRTNSTREDDETTTTSGSYTINHEELDEELAMSQYQVSQVV